MSINDPRPIETDRTKALEWWSKLRLLTRASLTTIYIGERKASTLTGSEIQMIWEEETDY